MHRIAVLLIFAAGLGLRLWNASAATFHPLETHAAGDARWALAPMDWAATLRFLRQHPADHQFLLSDSGTLKPWTEFRPPQPGHGTLQAWLIGPVMAALRPAMGRPSVPVVRVFNAVCDALTILLLPPAVAAMGAGASAGILTAALYAVFPPALGYGTVAIIEPLSAPLAVGLLLLLLRHDERPGRWLAAGIVTGLLLSTGLGGVVGLLLGPLVLLGVRPRAPAGVAVWAVGTLAGLALVVSPAAWARGALHAPDGFHQLHLRNPAVLPAALAQVWDTLGWYWIGIARHGEPFAAGARWHAFVTPVLLALFAAGALLALVRRRWTQILCLYAPALATLAVLPPDDDVYRYYPLFPLVCAAVACTLVDLEWRSRAALVFGAAAIAGMPFLPDRLNEHGHVDLPRLVALSGVRQPNGFYTDATPMKLILGPGQTVTRRFWLPPGRYVVAVSASGLPVVSIDGTQILDGSFSLTGKHRRGDYVDLEGWMHEIELSSRALTTYAVVAVRRPTDADLGR